jgi:hypothetical protein
MKTKAALALSLTGILLTGSAALAANSQTPSSGTGVSDDAGNVRLTDDSVTKNPAVAPAKASPSATLKAATKASDDKQADDKKAPAPKQASRPAEPGDDNGGLRTTAEPGDDNGGLRATAEPGDDKGGLRSAPASSAEPRDDRGGLVKAPEPGDDSGGHGGHGSDD